MYFSFAYKQAQNVVHSSIRNEIMDDSTTRCTERYSVDQSSNSGYARFYVVWHSATRKSRTRRRAYCQSIVQSNAVCHSSLGDHTEFEHNTTIGMWNSVNTIESKLKFHCERKRENWNENKIRFCHFIADTLTCESACIWMTRVSISFMVYIAKK